MKNLTVDGIKKEVHLWDPDIDEDVFGFRAAVVLMSAAFVTGPDTQRLAAFTGYPPIWVAKMSGRMQQAGLWKEGAVHSDHWFDGEKLTAGIWTDCLVAAGLMLARQREDGKWEYRSLNKGELQ